MNIRMMRQALLALASVAALAACAAVADPAARTAAHPADAPRCATGRLGYCEQRGPLPQDLQCRCSDDGAVELRLQHLLAP